VKYSDIIEVQNFNRSIMRKKNYTKSDLDYIRKIYNICNQLIADKHIAALFNGRYETIVISAQKQIAAYAAGKLHLSPDAYKAMNSFIDEFGKEYTHTPTGMKYEFTPEARRAKIMLNKANSRLKIKKIETDPVSKIAKPVTQQIKVKAAAKQIKKVLSTSKQNIKSIPQPTIKVDKETVIARLRKHMPSSSDIKSFFNKKNTAVIELKNKVDSYMPILEQQTKEQLKKQVKNIRHISSEVQEVGQIIGTDVSNIVRRYGVAVAALWGMYGAGNITTAGSRTNFANELKNKIALHIQQTKKSETDKEKTKILTAENFTTADVPEFDTKEAIAWLNNQGINYNEEAEDTVKVTPKTIADISFKEYFFTKEDLQALQVSEQGAELALHARKVVRNMNYPGYCYRGVKRMFNRANLGEMHGGSAYMAKKYLDNNPNFVRINCNVADLKYLPKGTVVVFGKGKSGVRPHGHIGVLDEVNGKMVDRSSKTYNVRETLGGYSSVSVYIHADTPLPQRVEDNIKKIMVLKHNTNAENETPVSTNYLSQWLTQGNKFIAHS